MVKLRTKDKCTPSPRWTPAHSRQRAMPYVTLAQSGLGVSHSTHELFEGKDRTSESCCVESGREVWGGGYRPMLSPLELFVLVVLGSSIDPAAADLTASNRSYNNCNCSSSFISRVCGFQSRNQWCWSWIYRIWCHVSARYLLSLNNNQSFLPPSEFLLPNCYAILISSCVAGKDITSVAAKQQKRFACCANLSWWPARFVWSYVLVWSMSYFNRALEMPFPSGDFIQISCSNVMMTHQKGGCRYSYLIKMRVCI